MSQQKYPLPNIVNLTGLNLTILDQKIGTKKVIKFL